MKFLVPFIFVLFFLSCSKGEKNDFDNKIIYANDYLTDPVSGDTVYMISIPSGFTPNADGINDFYAPQGFGVNDFVMKIFAGNGNMVYASFDLEQKWDGSVQGMADISEMGMYDVDISLTDSFGNSHRYLHRVTLFR